MARKANPKIVDDEMERLLAEEREVKDKIKALKAKKQAIRNVRLVEALEKAGVADEPLDWLVGEFQAMAARRSSAPVGQEAIAA